MSFSNKIIFTTAVIAASIALMFIDPKANNAGPSWFWRLGKRDPARWATFRPDGTLRKYTKVSLLVLWALFLFVIWLIT